MSLTGALNIGKSALAVSQAAIQTTGNNIANAGNAGYTRQVARLAPAADTQARPGIFLGNGVNLTAIQRQIDEALEGRLRGSISDHSAAGTLSQWLGRIEAVFNELTDDDLSTQLSEFFNSWSALANNPQDQGLRQVVLQNGQRLAGWINSTRDDLSGLQKDVDQRMDGLVRQADQLAGQIAELNQRIVAAEGGGTGQANGLRDQRDALLQELSELADIRTVMGPTGMANVYIGSEPLVTGIQSRGLAVRQEVADGRTITRVVNKVDDAAFRITSGQLGALADIQQNHIAGVIRDLDAVAGQLIFELNKLHASGQGLVGFTTVTAASAANDADAVLNDPAAGLAFTPVNGSFVLHVTDKSTGLTSSTLIEVDLDPPAGTTLVSLANALDSVEEISASLLGGKLRIDAAAGSTFSFSQDSSGILAVLGINTFFTGRDATNIALNPLLRERPDLLAAAGNGNPGDNRTALAIAALESAPLGALGGVTMQEQYQGMINRLAISTASARINAQAALAVNETLFAQREALSGVSLDEEAVNLMRQQRAFQGAARLIAAVDEMMETILRLV